MKSEEEIKAQIAKLEKEMDQFIMVSRTAIQMLQWTLAATPDPAPVTQEAEHGTS